MSARCRWRGTGRDGGRAAARRLPVAAVVALAIVLSGCGLYQASSSDALNRGRASFLAGHPERAVEALRHAAAERPHSALAHAWHGIAAETLPHVFDIFSQAKPALERAQGGLGIGLSLARGLVELHGGVIEARSDGLGKGSEFVVRLPVAARKVVQEAACRSEEKEQSGVTKLRILIVDDSGDSADSWALLLEKTGYEVRAAYDGEEAIAAAEEFTTISWSAGPNRPSSASGRFERPVSHWSAMLS